MEVSENPGIAVSTPGATTQRRVSVFEQININVFWIANNFHWQALLAIVIPSMVVKFLGDANKDINLAIVVIWGTLVAFAVNPLVGAISDYATFRLGRRRPFMIVGTIFNVFALVIFAFSPGDEDEARAALRDMLLVLPAARIQQFAVASIAEREAQITAAIRSIGDAG